jgi:DNA primase
VQKYDNLDFVEAVETIANEFGLAIEYDKSSKPVDLYLILSRFKKIAFINISKCFPDKNKSYTIR